MKLTPDERLYRDLWLAECSRPVPEWHQTAGEKERAEARNAAVMGADGFVIRALTCENGDRKTAPGPVVDATGRDPGPNPRSESEAPVNHAASTAACQQAVL